jgi:DMSO/TMAO reductase YedYZ molybdopterin-dependent catalytic subunit
MFGLFKPGGGDQPGGSEKSKQQPSGKPLGPEGLPEGVIVSPDVERSGRIPPGQSRTLKWPVLDAGGPPRIQLETWTLSISGLVNTPISWNWSEIQSLPRVRVFSDFHCVTRWSRLGNLWEGVSSRELISRAGGADPRARFVLLHAYDGGWTTNLPLQDFLAEDALLAFTHDGQPLSVEHGGPARIVVPRLYAWKSAKWVSGIELIEQDRAGFWERNGYHMHGDPWKEERFGWGV